MVSVSSEHKNDDYDDDTKEIKNNNDVTKVPSKSLCRGNLVILETKKNRPPQGMIMALSSSIHNIFVRSSVSYRVARFILDDDEVDVDSSDSIDFQELYTALLRVHLKMGSYLGPAICRPISKEYLTTIYQKIDFDETRHLDNKTEYRTTIIILTKSILTRTLIQWTLTLLIVPRASRKLWYFIHAVLWSRLLIPWFRHFNAWWWDKTMPLWYDNVMPYWNDNVLPYILRIMPKTSSDVGKKWEDGWDVVRKWWEEVVLTRFRMIPPSFWKALPIAILTSILCCLMVPFMLYLVDSYYYHFGVERSSKKESVSDSSKSPIVAAQHEDDTEKKKKEEEEDKSMDDEDRSRKIELIQPESWFRYYVSDKLFKSMDSEETGYVDSKELHTGLLLINLRLASTVGPAVCTPVSTTYLNKIFTSHDKDLSQKLDPDEFHHVMISITISIIKRILIQLLVTLTLVPILSNYVQDFLLLVRMWMVHRFWFSVAWLKTIVRAGRYHENYIPESVERVLNLVVSTAMTGREYVVDWTTEAWKKYVHVHLTYLSKTTFGKFATARMMMMGGDDDDDENAIPFTLMASILGTLSVPLFFARVSAKRALNMGDGNGDDDDEEGGFGVDFMKMDYTDIFSDFITYMLLMKIMRSTILREKQ